MSEDKHQNFNIHDILNKKPQFTEKTPLDVFFEDLDNNIITPINEAEPELASGSSVYSALKCADNSEFVVLLLQNFKKLHNQVLEQQKTLAQRESNLLPISLHDVKYVDELINLLIIHGIDANLPPTMKIPLDSKRLNAFKKGEKNTRYETPQGHTTNSDTLSQVVTMFYNILETETSSDHLRKIILKGSAYANVFLSLIALNLQFPNKFTSEMITKLENSQETYTLFGMYTLLVETIQDREAREIILPKLTTLTLRRPENGLISLIDFVLGVRDAEDIDAEKFNRVYQILMSKPKMMTNLQYLTELFRQIYDGLTFVNRPILIACLNGLILKFYMRNKKIVHDFLFQKVYSIIFNCPLLDHSEKELNDVINVLISLSKNSSKDLLDSLVTGYPNSDGTSGRFFLNIWIYALFLKKSQKLDPLKISELSISEDERSDIKNLTNQPSSNYYQVILSLLKSLMVITDNYQDLNFLSLNLLNFEHEKWKFLINLDTQLPYISAKNTKSVELLPETGLQRTKVSKFFQDMDLSVDLFMEFLVLLNDKEESKILFLETLKRWVHHTKKSEKKSSTSLDGVSEVSNDALVLMDLKILERMDKQFKSSIVSKPKDVLIVVDQLIDIVQETQEEEVDSDDEEERTEDPESINDSAFKTILQLLSTVLSESTSSVLLQISHTLESIFRKLQSFNPKYPEVDILLTSIDDILRNKHTTEINGNTEMEIDNDILDKAMTNLNDLLVPIKTRGLVELRHLVEKKSPVISSEKVLQIHMDYLKNSDPFIYLNVIKGLTALCELKPETTLPSLVEFYANKKNKNKLDNVLKVGEVFINYIQRQNQLFQGKFAYMIVDTCLGIVVPDKKAPLDNRWRMSAMSILGVCLQANARGLSDRIHDMIDCAFGILQLEQPRKHLEGKDDSFLMRRSAVHLINDLLYSTGLEMLPPEYTYNKLKTLLSYVHEQDEDYLVCEQVEKLLIVLDNL
ncbi:YMR185W [Saccharomyces arboricola H-6]|uniref:YMR185W n=1 Tax=Saccharomyces arboricola (strain H-6 / AS 2.3317 / CBS 10644) TaxID=1160507 RepID=J8Q3F3_SACAR|nr:YMR185W [Saccharomyces arboricola H-6]